MQVVVLNGNLSEAEQDFYVRHITDRFPLGMVEKVTLDVRRKYVEASYTLHRYRDLRKMGGYCIGEPADWNAAKQAELRDTIPNPIDGLV